MTRRKRILPQPPCRLMDEDGQHVIERMEKKTSKGRITYLCPECGFNVTIDAPEEDPEEARPEPSKEPSEKPSRKAAKEEPKKRPAYRKATKELEDGTAIEEGGHLHTLHKVTIHKPGKKLVFFEIFREDGEWIGRVSQAVSWQRTRDLIYRHYRPESERYPEGFTWTGAVRSLRGGTTLYVSIPKAAIERFDIRTDDEISITLGGQKPESREELYHISDTGGTKAVIVSKLDRMERREGVESSIPKAGDYVIVKAMPHPKTGRRNLCQWASKEIAEARAEGYRIEASKLGPDLKEEPTENPSEKPSENPPKNPPAEPEEEKETAEAVTVFNDF